MNCVAEPEVNQNQNSKKRVLIANFEDQKYLEENAAAINTMKVSFMSDPF